MVEAHLIQWRWEVLLQVPEDIAKSYLDLCLEEWPDSDTTYTERIKAVESYFLLYRVHRLETESEYPLDFNGPQFLDWMASVNGKSHSS